MVSPNYFGDVIKKTTGDTASGHIRQVVILLAKNALTAGETVSQVSDSLCRLAFSTSIYSEMMMWVWTSTVCPQRGTEPRDIPANNKVGNLIFPAFRILRQSQAPAIRLTHFLQELQKRDEQTSCPPQPRASASRWQGYE